MPYLKNVKFVFSILLMIFLLTACDKDQEPVIAPDENISTVSLRSLLGTANADPLMSQSDHEDDFICFEIVYPVDIIFPDGDTRTFTDEISLEAALDNYYDDNPETYEDPMPVYPMNVVFDDGTEQTVGDDNEFLELALMCWDYSWDQFMCFDFVYPITTTNTHGTQKTINNGKEMAALFLTLDDLYKEDCNFILPIDYPVEIGLEDGTTKTINDDDELAAVIYTCYEDFEIGFEVYVYLEDPCFDINFPISIQLGGEVIVIENEAAIESTIEQWYTDNPNSFTDIQAEYPIQITYDDGTQEVLNSDEDFEEAALSCFD